MSDAPRAARADFGDPTFEPTDAELHALAKEAFAGVGERHQAALARIREEVTVLRARVLAQLSDGTRGVGTPR